MQARRADLFGGEDGGVAKRGRGRREGGGREEEKEREGASEREIDTRDSCKRVAHEAGS